eukprot:scaffold110004_cov33-Attheya_sp.AAC.1
MYHVSVETTVRVFPRIGLNEHRARVPTSTRSYRRLQSHPRKVSRIVVQIHSRTAEQRGSPIDNSRPLYRYEKNAGHQKQWKSRGFHVCIGACMTGECIREGQWQLRLKAVVRGMWRYSGGGGGGGDFLARLLV